MARASVVKVVPHLEPAVFTRYGIERAERSADQERQEREEFMGVEDDLKRLARRQEHTSACALGVGAIALLLAVYVAARVDRLADQVSALPAQISSEMRQAIKTAEDAAVAKPPQVLVLPTTQVPRGASTSSSAQQQASPPPVVLGPHGSFGGSR